MKTVCFGEIMLRLSPPGFERFLQTPQFVATSGGGEANVAVSLAAFGLESHYVTRLPANAIGEAAVKALRAEGVRTEHIVRGGDRIGVYYAESSASQRVNTSFVERQNGTDRGRNARKARKTYRFSKDWQVHEAMTYLTMYSSNFCWCVRTLRVKAEQGRWQQRTPALAAKLTDHVWTWEEWFRRPAIQSP